MQLVKCKKCKLYTGVMYHCSGHFVLCVSCGKQTKEFKTMKEAAKAWSMLNKNSKGE